MNPPLEVHSNSPPVINDNWEKYSLTAGEVGSLKPLLEWIGALKLMGLSGAGIVASFVRRRIQPLMAREHLGFEYTGPKDPSRLVPDDELDEGGVLQRLQKVLKGVSVMPLRVKEYDSTHPPPAISFFPLYSELFFCFCCC
jgi:hypothetical protein